MHGVLNIDKPAGVTSHDVVACLRRLTGVRRIGHGGTLDPGATGVLVLGLGQATRLLEYLHDVPKQYRADIRFGLTTSTQDLWGETLSERDASDVTEALLLETLSRFRGAIEQTPPMVSAVKVGGERLYRAARRGEEVDRPARRVTIHALEVLRFDPGAAATVRLRVECSAGTYIRTLAHDLGEALGCGAALAGLLREAVGPFRIEDAAPLVELEQAPDRIDDWVQPMTSLVEHLPVVALSPEESVAIGHGKTVAAPADAAWGQRVRLMGVGGELVAIASVREGQTGSVLQPEKVFKVSDVVRAGA